MIQNMNRFVVLPLTLCLANSTFTLANSLSIREIGPFPRDQVLAEQSDQLPQSRAVRGKRDIATAWLAGPTTRYQHGVLGDALEASRLMVETQDGDMLMFELPASRVFEDLEPRLEDLDGDNRDEILIVESDVNLGASLAIYGIVEGRMTRRAMTPFLGRPNRWLNPVGAGDFDADGRLDVAIVVTPHIGGILRLYHFTEPTLAQFGETSGISTHRIGSTELGLGQVVPLGSDGDGLLVPDQAHRALILFKWSSNGLRVLDRTDLPSPISSSLTPTSMGRWRFSLDDGRHMEIQLD